MSKRIAPLVLIMMTVIGVNLGFVNWRLMSDRVRMNQIDNHSYMRDMTLLDGHKKQDVQIGRLVDYQNRVVDLIRERMPSVVAVHAEYVNVINPYTGKPRIMSAAGVVISSDGMILTASHVVDDLNFSEIGRYWVVFEDGTEREIKRVAYAPDRNPDVGMIWIDPNGLDLCPVERSEWEDLVIQGEQVLVLGSPYGNDHSASVGIVSCEDRMSSEMSEESQFFIQIDAPVNGGNSGGPVFDMDGKLIGIVSWKYDADGLSFIVPVKRILEGVLELSDPMDVVLGG